MTDPSRRSRSKLLASQLSALKSISDLISQNKPLSGLINRQFDANDLSSLSQDELSWLKLNGLQRFVSITFSSHSSRDSANQAQRDPSLRRGLTSISTTSTQRSLHIRFKTQ